MEDMGKGLRITLIASISWEMLAEQPVTDGNKCGVLTVGHSGYSLNKEGVAGVEIYSVVGVLSTLSHTYPGFDPVVG